MKRLIFLGISIVLLIGGMGLFAEGTYGEVLGWTKMGASARAFGMGGAYCAVAEGPDAAFYNPAGLAQEEKRELTSMYAIMKLDQKVNWNSYLNPLPRNQVVGVSWLRYYLDKIEKRDESGNLEGYIDNTENIFRGSYALQASSHLYVGVNFNYLEHKIDTTSADTFSFDAGFLYKLDNIKIGGVVKHMGGEYEWNNANHTKEDIPLIGIFGIAYYPWRDLLLTADIEKRTDVKAIYRAGLEYWVYRSFALRAGVDDGEITWGASFKADNWTFDYGYQDSDLGELHRIAVSLGF